MTRPVDDTVADATDRAIIAALEADGRATYGAIGDLVGLSAPAVKRRMDRLVDDGVIRGFTAVVDHSRLGRPLEAFTELRFAGNARVDDIATIGTDIPEVLCVFTMAGDPDALAWLRVRDVDDLKRVIDRLRQRGNVIGTKTMMVLGNSIAAGPQPAGAPAGTAGPGSGTGRSRRPQPSPR